MRCTNCVPVILTNTTPIIVKWVTNLKGDFSFRHKWEYPEGVYKNKYGQLICDGLCPNGAENMLDHNRKILKDSLKAFYKILDTTHLYHSISCTAWSYEWSGTDFIETTKTSLDTFFLKTALNVGTHCSLELVIVGDTCFPVINLNSVFQNHGAVFYCKEGYITIDESLWQKGIVKAVFEFKFRHDKDSEMPMFWKGKIYSKINPESTNR